MRANKLLQYINSITESGDIEKGSRFSDIEFDEGMFDIEVTDVDERSDLVFYKKLNSTDSNTHAMSINEFNRMVN